MSLYRITPDKLEPVARTTFAAESLFERRDLQRLLRRDLSPIGDNLMVIAEEYGEWEDSSRRIDLFCLSKDASLVVVEIKRTDDGGHMELQALRYAAMVSSMTLEQVIRAYSRSHGSEEEVARSEVLGFLQLESTDNAELSGEVRIVLVSADFSTELTTAVLWLNNHNLDITCIRLRPHKLGSDILVDATQIIPLPEAADYEVKLRTQEQEKRKVESIRGTVYRQFWMQFIERSNLRLPLLIGRAAPKGYWLLACKIREFFELSLSLFQDRWQAECYFRLPSGDKQTITAFHGLEAKRTEIEEKFGGPLEWDDMPGRRGCRIRVLTAGGFDNPEAEWPAIQDRMIDVLIRLEHALKEPVLDLVL